LYEFWLRLMIAGLISDMIKVMKKNQLILVILILVVIIAVGAAMFIRRNAQLPVTSFDTCVKSKGSTVLMTYPETCTTTDGKRFTQPQ